MNKSRNGLLSTPQPKFQFRDSIVVSISACHAEDPGSIPGRGSFCRTRVLQTTTLSAIKSILTTLGKSESCCTEGVPPPEQNSALILFLQGASTGLVSSSLVCDGTGQMGRPSKDRQDDRTTPTASKNTNKYTQYTHDSWQRRHDSGFIHPKE